MKFPVIQGDLMLLRLRKMAQPNNKTLVALHGQILFWEIEEILFLFLGRLKAKMPK
jgi:hypothetical protein